MLSYEELSKLWSEDAKIDATDIIGETLKLPLLHSKYYDLFITETLRLRKLEAKRNTLIRDKSDYYNGNMDIEDVKERGWSPLVKMIIKADVQKHIDADTEIIDLNLRISYVREVAEFLKDILKQISNRGYNLRLIHDVRKFESGE